MQGRKRIDARTQRNWALDFIVFVAGVVTALSGIYFLYFVGGYQGGRNALYGVHLLFERHTWHDLHLWGGVIFTAAAIVHIAWHWGWIVASARRVWLALRCRGASMSTGSRINLALNVIVAASFLIAAASGIYFLLVPAGGFQGGRAAGWDPMLLMSRTSWDLVHTWSGTVFVASAVAHFWIHWRWVVNVTRRVAKAAVPGIATRTEPAAVRVRSDS